MPPLEMHRIALPVLACLMLAVLAARIPRYRFALLGLAAVVGYAILQDQVSVRLCPEYFTKLHNPIRGVNDPTLLAVCWGFLRTWWGGAAIGYAAGLCATLGPRPQLTPRELLAPLALLVGAIAAVTALTGYGVWEYAKTLGVILDSDTSALVPVKRHRELLTVVCYHLVAYASSAIGGIALCVWVSAERRRRAKENSECLTNPPTSSVSSDSNEKKSTS